MHFKFGGRLAFIAVLLLVQTNAWSDPGAEDSALAARLHLAGETPKAIALWQTWAEKGDVDAAYNLAVVHQYGDGVAANPTEALRWNRYAAERDDLLSQYQLGMMYLRGEGVAADEEEAHRWFVKHRAHHFHHQHTPQMTEWRREALALLRERDMHESLAAALRDGDSVVAELKRRSGIPSEAPANRLAAMPLAPAN